MTSPLSFEIALRNIVRSWLKDLALDASSKEAIMQGLIVDILKLRQDDKNGKYISAGRAVAMNPIASERMSDRLAGRTHKPPKPPQTL
jgi:hypothetical protein